ncbi:hypothetical protein E4U31_003010 [Claviceps sp. LM219 group G6]|nr:hypothetical protein E4U31_003010 [Claviceps sp. LM219 group G6]
MAAGFRVKALYEYTSPHEDDLNFDVGQIITITEAEDDDWYTGEYTDDHGVKKEGIFPRNFVEKLEPIAPPRPTRSRPKKESEAAPAAPPEDAAPTAPSPPAPEHGTENTRETSHAEPEPHVPTVSESVPGPVATKSSVDPVSPKSPTVPKSAETPVPKPKPGPPVVSEKPLSSSFKDRIAAFNKPAAPPVAPFGPGRGAATGSHFVKKPFVAPPPSRNAYVPPPTREKPKANIYRREEDPEIKEAQAQSVDQAEKAGLVPVEQQAQEGTDEDQPKPTSLKERIALLQKQQMEQAQRHADAASKKEKPKKPLKKSSEAGLAVEDGIGTVERPSSPSLERAMTAETEPRTSTDDTHPRAPPPPRRRASKGPAVQEIHDGNEADMSGAGDTTEGQDDTAEREDGEDKSRDMHRVPTNSTAATKEEKSEDGEADENQEAEEQDDVDPEVRRKEELRARMAKMSGGMGFHGMFGGPVVPMPKAPLKKKAVDSSSVAENEAEMQASRAPPPPIPTAMALPGMGNPNAPSRSHQEVESKTHDDGDDDDVDEDEDDDNDHDATPVPSREAPPPVPTRAPVLKDDAYDEEESVEEATTSIPSAAVVSPRRNVSGPLPILNDRAVPPPIPTESRAPPPPPPAELPAPTDGSESDDELSAGIKDKDLEQAEVHDVRSPTMAPPTPFTLPMRSPPLSPNPDEFSPSSPPAFASKRMSRPPPPIPGFPPAPPPASSRPPPPLPPSELSRPSTTEAIVVAPIRPSQAGEEDDEEITEYEGDYDTDIGSSVPHKDALKVHGRESGPEETTLQPPSREAPPNLPPPVPAAAAPRAVPPPIPSQPPPDSKSRSVDIARAAPPPPPAVPAPTLGTPSASASKARAPSDVEDYDPYNYASPPLPLASSHSQKPPMIDEEQGYPPGTAAAALGASPSERRPPPPTTLPLRPSNRQSVDLSRTSISNRRSVDMYRPPAESDFIANDVDLAVQSGWWKQGNQVPPVFQGRKDIHFESEESTTTNQGSKTTITRDVFILFQDYSQTIITIRYDPYDASSVELEQRHEAPPRALRQDQMEEFYERFGRHISNAATSRKDTVVDDGTAQGFVMELLRPLSAALPPVGTRSYGALVYANMANASTQQQDVIRAGDIISFRNSKFQGKHGPMHARYSAEVGKPDHVAVVAEWDGTKKKVRAWEQGRENRKVKMESYKLDDLRSGEVKIWRVVPRTWVGWNSQP